MTVTKHQSACLIQSGFLFIKYTAPRRVFFLFLRPLRSNRRRLTAADLFMKKRFGPLLRGSMLYLDADCLWRSCLCKSRQQRAVSFRFSMHAASVHLSLVESGIFLFFFFGGEGLYLYRPDLLFTHHVSYCALPFSFSCCKLFSPPFQRWQLYMCLM